MTETVKGNHGLTMKSVPVAENPNIADMPEGSLHFLVTLHSEHGIMQTFFSVGPGIVDQWIGDESRDWVRYYTDNKHYRAQFRSNPHTIWADEYRQAITPHYRPQIEDVLDCLRSDAIGVENARSFEEWAEDCGLDSDSRKALKIFHVCEQQARELRHLLGSREAFETFLAEDTE